MKKLMFAAAIAAAGVALADIESTTIVGYMNKDMVSAGYYNYTPMFVGVDGSNPAINEIKPSSTVADDLGGGKLSLYVLDTDRKFSKTYAYQTVDSDWADVDGWYGAGDEVPTADTLGAGESVQVMTSVPVTFTFAGAVDQGAYDFTAPVAGYYMVGNQHATEMAINAITPSSTAVVDLGGGKLVFYALDTDRKFAKTYTYQTIDSDWADVDGWYGAGDEELTAEKLAAGAVLQLNTANQVKLAFPAQ